MEKTERVIKNTKNSPDLLQFLTFSLAGEIYAIEILKVREIIDYGKLTQVPMVPEFIRGVINLRGSVVPVIDLATRFGGTPTHVSKRTAIVIVEISDEENLLSIGIVVDAVNDVLDLATTDIEPSPEFGANIRTDFIKGMGKLNNNFLILLDVEKVLAVDELSHIEKILDKPPSNPNSDQSTYAISS